MGKALATWYSKATHPERHEVNVYTVRENTGLPTETVGVQQIRVTSPRFTVTGSQLSCGSSLSQIRKQFYGLTYIAHYRANGHNVFLYDAVEQGIAFEIRGQDSTCVGIAIHPKHSPLAARYLPVHQNLEYLKQ